MVARDTFVKMLCMQILLTEYHLLSGKYERSGITVTDLDIVKGFSFTMSLLILNFSHAFVIGKRSGLMVSALDSGARCPDSSPGRGHCVVSWGKTLTLTVPLSTQVYKGVPANLIQGVTLGWTSIPFRGE